MTDPAEARQVVGRRWSYAPPPWRMFEALTDEQDDWLALLTGETRPVAAETTRPTLVTFRPWLDPVIELVTVEITSDGPGSSLRILATPTAGTWSDDQRRWTRYRLGMLFGGALRHWVDEPHH